MGTVSNLLTVARKEIGVSEQPKNSNHTKYGAWIGMDYQPWCMSWVQWCFAQVNVKLPERTASCGEFMRAAQKQNMWVTTNFQTGDIVIYDFSGGRKTTQHCGIVEEVGITSVQAIEGNTSERGSQDNGGMVCRKVRGLQYIIGAVRPVYDAEIKQEDVSKMTTKEFIDKLTDEQAYTLLQKAQKYAATLDAPTWALGEIAEAIKIGITDGSRPMALTTRYETAIMTKRATKK